MNEQTRKKSLIYLLLVIIGVLLLAASLPSLEFQQGLPIPGADSVNTSAGIPSGSKSTSVEFQWGIQLFLALVFVVLMVILVVSIIKKFNVRKVLPAAGGLLLVFCLFLLANRIELAPPRNSPASAEGIEIQPSVSYATAPIGEPPAELFQIVLIILIIGGVFLLFWLLLQLIRQRKKNDRVASEATAALKAIENGDDLRNVVIRVYMQMLTIAKEEQGIERLDSTTPREFERVMSSRGIPTAPLHQLTDLFEKVRYGSKPTNKVDEQSAIESLSAIQFSSKSKGSKTR